MSENNKPTMSEKNSESKEKLPVDDIDAEELLATTQANISNELAKKIWSVTSSDVALGIREFPGEKLPYVPLDFGSMVEAVPVSGSGGGSNGFGNLEQAANGDSKPPPGLERSMKPSPLVDRNQIPTNGGATAAASGSKYPGPSGGSTALPQQQQRQAPRPQPAVQHRQPGDEMSIPQMYQFNQMAPQAQLNPSHHQSCPHLHASHVHPPQPPVGSAPQSPMATALQQQKQHRPGGAHMSGTEIGGGGGLCGHSHVHYHGHSHGAANEFNLSQLYQQLMARNMRPNPMHHQQHHQQQQHMAQNQQQNHHHTTTCAAAAAAMLYFEQHIRQLHMQQQLQQQQQRHARIPRGIYGGNGGQGVLGAPPGSGAGAGGVGAIPPTSKDPPATGHN
ncbi:hypothetical protein KR032_011034 [Drosophila birchii]|nr:hypothetical protein KR032_011034 [Drosophila birchii]